MSGFRADRAAPSPVPIRPIGGRAPVRASLPAPLTSFVGREQEVAALVDHLRRDDVRLVTLVGPGGIGKTRLALQAAARAVPDFPDGTWFVPLAAIRDARLVASAMVRELGIGRPGDRRTSSLLAGFLRDRHALLVLDNAEHLLDAMPPVADLLVACPRLTVLVTSRAVLHLSGEHRVTVPPLQVPPEDQHLPLERLLAADAGRLFVERATAAGGVAAAADDAPVIAEICRRLDGLPLAIELAAARVGTLPPRALLARLDRQLPLLSGGPRDQPARLHAMRNAITWSYDLLSPAQQTLFRRLAVFVGGFTLTAAEAVMGDGDGIAPPSPMTHHLSPTVLDGVTALVEQSLVRAAGGPGGGGAEPRFAMLESLREFGLERLEAAGERLRVEDAHAAYFVTLDGWLDPNHGVPPERFDNRLRAIEAEHPNLLAALARLATTGDAEGVLRLAGALAIFWHHRGFLREGRRWLEWALSRTPEADSAPRARALNGLALVIWTQGDADPAEPLARAALAIAERIDAADQIALAFHILGLIELHRGRYDRAGPPMAQALAGWRALGRPTDEAMALNTLSNVAREHGDIEESVRLAQASLAIFRTCGHTSGVAMSSIHLARAAHDRGDARDAAALYHEALRFWSDLGERWAIARAIAGLARVAAAHGHPEEAAAIIGALTAHLEAEGSATFPASTEFARAAADSRAALGDARFAELCTRGRALRFEGAVALAAEVPIPAEPLPPAKTPNPNGFGTAARLSPREREVLALLAEGLADRAIAERLSISPWTAKRHVSHILAKLDLPNRAAAAAFAARLGHG